MRDPFAARWMLVVAPHPDDETIGCGGAIRHARARGMRVAVLVVTDGAASHRSSASHPPAILAKRRQRETRAAIRALGLRLGDLTMLWLPDGGLDTLDARGRGRLARAFARYRGFDLVLTPDPAEAHPDHRDTARAALRAFRDRRCLRYTVWPSPRTPRRRIALPIARYRSFKGRALSRHRSQLGGITDDPGAFAIDTATHRRFLLPVERFAER